MNSEVPSARFLRLPEVLKLTGLSKPTIYGYIRKGTFPAPIKLGARASGWLESSVTEWIVKRIEASRTAA